jgi:energy-coupling factor transport system substrate-specific component
MNRKFTVTDIVLMALLAAANGVLTYYLAFINKTLTAVGGPILTSTITGLYMLYGLLAIYIIRKPGAALITYFIGAAIQILTGIAYGAPSALIAAACYAAFVELVFALFRYARWDAFAVSLAALCAVPLWFLCAAYLYGYLEWGLPILLAAFVVRCLSGIALGGLAAKWLGDRLAASGLLRFFPAGEGGQGRDAAP